MNTEEHLKALFGEGNVGTVDEEQIARARKNNTYKPPIKTKD